MHLLNIKGIDPAESIFPHPEWLTAFLGEA